MDDLDLIADPHHPEVVGSNPALATIETSGQVGCYSNQNGHFRLLSGGDGFTDCGHGGTSGVVA